MAQNYYEILGIGKDAKEEDIKRAYRKLAQKHHPDRNKGDKTAEEKFKEINKAYEVLSDKQKRQQYDQFGEAGPAGQGGGFPGGFDFGGGGFSGFGENFSDIFENFFGGEPNQAKSRKNGANGADREIRLTITFEEAAFGVEKEIKINRIGACDVCLGSGAAPRTKILTCPACQGAGEIRSIRQTILGQMSTRRACETCSGTGKIPQEKCPSCHGVGRVRVTEKLRVKVPAGIHNEAIIRLSGKGDAGVYGGESGDLYVHIQMLPHKHFQRKESDVYSTQEIQVLQAVLGDVIDVLTIHGTVKMRIPAGIESGKAFRIKESGVPKLRGDGRGDHFVTIRIKIPQKLTKRERELYQELARESGLQIQDEKGFFKRMMG